MEHRRNREIYEEWCNGVQYGTLADRYDIGFATVQHIIRRQQMLDTALYGYFKLASDVLGYKPEISVKAYCEFLRKNRRCTTIEEFQVRDKHTEHLDAPSENIYEEVVKLVGSHSNR